MNEGWTKRWKALLIWLCGYLSIVAFALVGGYVIVKSEDEDLKKTTKLAFIVTLIFTAISMFFSIFSSIGSMANNYYSSGAYDVYNILYQVTNIIKIAVYVVFAVIAFFGKNGSAHQSAEKQKKDETPTGEESVQ